MTTKKLKFLIGAALIVSAIGYLISTSISKTSMYFVTVAELEKMRVTYANAELKVKGSVVKGSILRDPTDYMNVSFSIEDDDKKSLLKVRYKGVTPDMFKDEGQVVVEGVLKEGVFHATTLLTSCPSKYEAEKGATHPGGMTPNELKKPEITPAAGEKTSI